MVATLSLSGCTVIDNSFFIGPGDTISSLYHWAREQVEEPDGRGISIVFKQRIILELINDRRTLDDIGMDLQFNDIVLIQKPLFVSLLEMVHDIENKDNIPWHAQAIECLYESSAKQYHFQSVSEFEKGLDFDANGDLIGLDLSHLNLTGTLHLNSLPQTVRSLDLSFNDLDILNLDELRGKSLETLNMEHNIRCHINTEFFPPKREQGVSFNVLQLSSNQIFPWITCFGEKLFRIKRCNWFNEPRTTLKDVIIDGMSMRKWCSLTNDFGQRNSWNHYDDEPFQIRMLRVVEGVTNKEVIPWYPHFLGGAQLNAHEWKALGVAYCRGRGKRIPHKFNMGGLGLKGHIDLGCLPKNVIKMDLSNNNLSSISFAGRGPFSLGSLNIQNNSNLRIDLMQLKMCMTSASCCLSGLHRLDISSNQLLIDGLKEAGLSKSAKQIFVKEWLRTTRLHGIILDDVGFITRNCSIQAERRTGRVTAVECASIQRMNGIKTPHRGKVVGDHRTNEV